MRTLVETQVLVGRARGLSAGEGAGQRGRSRRRRRRSWRRASTGLPPEDKRLLQAASVIGKDVPFALLHAIADDAGGRPSPGAQPPPGGRVPLRDEPLPGPRVHLQACADPRGRLRKPPPGPPARAPRPDRRGHRDALRRAPDRARRAAGPPRLPGRAVGEGGDLPPAGRGQGLRPVGQPGGGRRLRAGAGGAEPIFPRPARRWSRASTFASLSETRSGPSAASRPASGISATPNAWPRTLDDQRRLGWIAAYLSEHTRQTGHAADAPPFAERALTIAEGVDDLQLARRRELLSRLGLFRRGRLSAGRRVLLPDPPAARGRSIPRALWPRRLPGRDVSLLLGVCPRRARRVRPWAGRGKGSGPTRRSPRPPLHSDQRLAGPKPSPRRERQLRSRDPPGRARSRALP